MAHTAPPGYENNYAAIMDLIRFGPAIWSCAQLKVLLFHAERSTVYGKDADRHSEKQAVEGIYSARRFEWVRGPAGLSRAGWYQANGELLIDEEEPAKTPDGVLRRRRGDGRYEPNEYEIDWRAVKGRISRWKSGQGSRIWTPESKSRGPDSGRQGSRIWTPEEKPDVVANQGAKKIEGSRIWTHSQDFDFKSDFDSQSDGFSVTRDAIMLELEVACAARATTDRPANQILKANQKLNLPRRVIGLFLQAKADDFRARRYPFHPGLLAKAFVEEIIPWCKTNRAVVESAVLARDRGRQQAPIAAMPAAGAQAKSAAAAAADPAFAQELVGELKKRVGKRR